MRIVSEAERKLASLQKEKERVCRLSIHVCDLVHYNIMYIYIYIYIAGVWFAEDTQDRKQSN